MAPHVQPVREPRQAATGGVRYSMARSKGGTENEMSGSLTVRIQCVPSLAKTAFALSQLNLNHKNDICKGYVCDHLTRIKNHLPTFLLIPQSRSSFW